MTIRSYLTADDIALLDRIATARCSSEWGEYWPGPRDPTAPAPGWVIGFVERSVGRLSETELEDIAAVVHAELERRA